MNYTIPQSWENYAFLNMISYLETEANKCDPNRFQSILDTALRTEDVMLVQGFLETASKLHSHYREQWCEAFSDLYRFTEILSQRIGQLQSDISQEENKFEYCDKDKQNLVKQKYQCIDAKKELGKNNTELTAKVSDLTREKNQCEAQQQELIEEKSNLEGQIDQLSSGHNDLCNQCNKEFSDMGLEYRIECII